MSGRSVSLSLLWPPGHGQEPDKAGGSPTWWEDLDLAELLAALNQDGRQHNRVRTILLSLPSDPEVIRYRQAIFQDLDENEELLQALAGIVPPLRELEEAQRAIEHVEDNQLLRVLRRLRELSLFVETVQKGLAVLNQYRAALHSQGLLNLRERLSQIASDESFMRLADELPKMAEALEKVASVTIGVNLDRQARPVAATLLSVNEAPFEGRRSLLARLLGRGEEKTAGAGITDLHEVAANSPSPFLQPLFRDLAEVLRTVCRPVAQALAGYEHLQVRVLDGLAGELTFYLGGIALANRMRESGLPVCQPQILERERRHSSIEGLYNISLALRLLLKPPPDGFPQRPVPSNLELGEVGRTSVLTGPNRGGKTTYIQAVGLAHVMAQSGLFVPACRGEISPVDAIYTHFPIAERPEAATGRLGEEAQRLAEIFAQATPNSLVLLNESLSSTSPGESLYLAQDILCALRLLGARSIYATHLHELAANLETVDRVAPDEPSTVSLVAGISPLDEGGESNAANRTFHIAPGLPHGKSYADEIARQYGISLAQLQEKLTSRGIKAEGEDGGSTAR